MSSHQGQQTHSGHASPPVQYTPLVLLLPSEASPGLACASSCSQTESLTRHAPSFLLALLSSPACLHACPWLREIIKYVATWPQSVCRQWMQKQCAPHFSAESQSSQKSELASPAPTSSLGQCPGPGSRSCWLPS